MSAAVYDLAAIDRASPAIVGANPSARPVAGPAGRSWLGLGAAESADLWRSAGSVDRDTYTIARCIASETPGPAAALLSIGEAIVAECRAAGLSPWALLTGRTSAEYEFTRGRYGEQHGRFASTARAPSARQLEAARQAKAGSDIARGARRWLSLRTLDKGQQAGRNVERADVVVSRWAGLGWEWVGPLAGVDSYRHALFALVKGRPVDTRPITEIITRGRSGRSSAEPSQAATNITTAAGAVVVVGGALAAVKLTGG